ncbi:hypothetical protein FB567DRAFT_598356 [Paraphoma chrysanthemicola]|uniref:Uncharacterized protein n=1 Tax=Paraphoma chrysanthemicola TaxID=798071 RepID=A0A8K0QTM5_9PLEO|nr:hypothetical protein FB567DRAFT_598356 [Paraphoma chrysanthemicola]
MAITMIPGTPAKDIFKGAEVVRETRTTTTAREAAPKRHKQRSCCSYTWLYVMLVVAIAVALAMCTAAFRGEDPIHYGKTAAHYSIFKDIRAADKHAGLEALRARRARSREMNIRWEDFFEDEPASTSFETTSDILHLLERHAKENQEATRNIELLNSKLREVEAGAMEILSLATTRFVEAEISAANYDGKMNYVLTRLHPQLPFDRFAPYAPATQAKVLGQEMQMELARFMNSHTHIFDIVDTVQESLEAEFWEFGAFSSRVRVGWIQPLGAAVCGRAKLQEMCTRAEIVRASDKEVHDQIEEFLTKGKEEYLGARQKDTEVMRAVSIGLEAMARFYDDPIRVETLDDLWMVLQQLTDKLVALVMVDEDGDRKLVR